MSDKLGTWMYPVITGDRAQDVLVVEAEPMAELLERCQSIIQPSPLLDEIQAALRQLREQDG